MKQVNYRTAKAQHVDREMSAGKSKEQANRSWSHGDNNPRGQYLNNVTRNNSVNESGYNPPSSQWGDYAHVSGDL